MEKYLEAAELVLGTLFPADEDKAKAATPDEVARLERPGGRC